MTRNNIINGCLRLAAAGLLLVPLVFWMGTLQASINPYPKLHFDSLEVPPEGFPTPEALRDNVAFWRRVFAEWHMNQVVLHDADYPSLVYEVVNLTGKTAESLTSKQYDQIQQRREALEDRLTRLAATGGDAKALSEADRALRRKIIAIAGIAALADAAARVRAQRGLRERFHRGLEISGRYVRAFRQVFREEGVPEDLAYLPHVESSFQNRARSSAGAAGMWQFTRSAGRLFMTVNRTIDQRMDPVVAARGAARYLRRAYEMLGDWPMAVTSYNHGIKGMMRAKEQYGGDFNRIVRDYESRTFGFASRNFYAEFLAARDIARDHEHYFPKGLAMQHPLELDSVALDRPIRVHQLARYYAVKLRKLAALNPAWTRRAVRGFAPIPAGVTVWLPAGTLTQLAEEKPLVPPPPPVTVYHIVRANESLSTIAQQYGLSTQTLRALNDIAPHSDLIRVGQKLRVRDATEPAVAGDMIVHVVRKGDNPWVIASDYGIAVKDLLDANQLTRRSVIRPGQRLDIPVGR